MARMQLEGELRYYRIFVIIMLFILKNFLSVFTSFPSVTSFLFNFVFLREAIQQKWCLIQGFRVCILGTLINVSKEKLLTACLWRPQYRQDSPPGLLVPLRILRRPRGQDSLKALFQKNRIIKNRGWCQTIDNSTWYVKHFSSCKI